MTGRAAACWELPDVRRGGRLSGRSRRFSAGCHGFSILEKRALTQIQNTLADSRFAGVGSTFSSRILDLQVRGVHFHCGFSICRCEEYIFIADSRFAGAGSTFSSRILDLQVRGVHSAEQGSVFQQDGPLHEFGLRHQLSLGKWSFDSASFSTISGRYPSMATFEASDTNRR